MNTLLKKLRPSGWTTPGWLHLILVLDIVAVGIVFFCVRAGVDRQHQAVKTVTQDATTGIIAAEHVKSGLAEMSALGEASFQDPTDSVVSHKYIDTRRQVSKSLVEASEHVTYPTAEETPIQHINYVLPQYYKLLEEAKDQHDKAKLEQANVLMNGTLLPAADALDQANSYVLNQTYDGQEGEATVTTHKQVMTSGLILLAILGIAQLYYIKRFRRTVSLPLAVATLVAVGFFGYSLMHFASAKNHVRAAKEDAFDSVHVLLRARTMAQVARQEELAGQINPANADAHKKAFTEAANAVLGMPAAKSSAAVVSELQSGAAPDDLTGDLSSELRNVTYEGEREAAVASVSAFSAYIDAVNANQPTASKQAFDRYLAAVDQTTKINQDHFGIEANLADGALSGLDALNLIVAIALAFTIFIGINARLKEYSVGA